MTAEPVHGEALASGCRLAILTSLGSAAPPALAVVAALLDHR
jgi:hypothetical protein